MIEKILERLREKFNCNSEQAEIWREGSDKDAYFREKKDLYLDRANTYGSAIEIVQEVAKEYGNEWIPVIDHLPSDFIGRYYLTTEKGYCDVSINYFSVADKKWYTDSDCRVPTNVVAWTELPTPYQKGE